MNDELIKPDWNLNEAIIESMQELSMRIQNLPDENVYELADHLCKQIMLNMTLDQNFIDSYDAAMRYRDKANDLSDRLEKGKGVFQAARDMLIFHEGSFVYIDARRRLFKSIDSYDAQTKDDSLGEKTK